MKRFWKRNASTILTVAGGIGVIATTISAVKATPKAMKLIDEAKEKKGEELTKWDIVKTAAPTYIPTVLMGAATVACIFGAQVLNKRSQAALMSAYALMDQKYKDYKNKAKELYGSDADARITEEIAKDKYEEEDIQDTDDGKQLYYDNYSERYFRATSEDVIKAQYAINRILVEDGVACINEYYHALGIDTVDYGDEIGWNVSQMFDNYWTSWIEFYQEKVEMEDGMECTIIHMLDPMSDYTEY